MGCVEVLLKIFLFIVNFVIGILGLVIIAAGAVLAYFQSYIDWDGTLLIAIITIVAGCVLFIIAFCGCCGAIGGIPCCLIFYGIFIILLTAVNIYLVVIVYINKDAAEYTISDFLNKQFEDPNMRNTFYFIEYMFSCCGTTGADSYDMIELTIPPTCCSNANFPSLNDLGNIEDMINNLNGTAEFCAKEETFRGCSPLVTNFFITIFDVVAWLLIAALIVQVIVVVSSFYLAGSARKYRGKVIRP